MLLTYPYPFPNNYYAKITFKSRRPKPKLRRRKQGQTLVVQISDHRRFVEGLMCLQTPKSTTEILSEEIG
jgi:hypothetical protein